MMSDKKKRVAVTGAFGKIGQVTVKRLRDAGYDIFLIDRVKNEEFTEPTMIADLQDFGATLDALSSAGEDVYATARPQAFDAVVHLASLPHPRMIPDSAEFQNNMVATFNVFEASRRLGIKNIVWTASEVATGVPYDQWDAPYVPVDETYPHRGLSIYALTKVLGEEMARQFCLNNPDMRITCLRLSNVMNPEEYAKFDGWQDDPTERLWNMWTYVDVRDVAQSIELAIEYDVRGKDEFFITSDVTCMRTPTQELLEKYYPDTERRKEFEGNESVLSSDKATRVLGYKPQHRWTDGA